MEHNYHSRLIIPDKKKAEMHEYISDYQRIRTVTIPNVGTFELVDPLIYQKQQDVKDVVFTEEGDNFYITLVMDTKTILSMKEELDDIS